ncbi:MAG: stage V sporulation protein AA [Clostridium sp.]|nr:stage V sporulation protein AA [Clostridium sp.]
MRIFYLKADAKVELERRDIRLADVADVLCEDDRAQRAAQELIVYRFSGEERAVIDVLKLIGLLHEKFPGCQVVSLGADAVLLEYHQIKPHPVWEKVKIALIALLSFFGAAFTIMAFHNDISIDDIFSKVYLLVTGMESDGFTVLEISYSVGLSAGILLFFNHIGTRRITKDPTPIEVQMRQYESDVVTALVENADRERAHEDCGGKRENCERAHEDRGERQENRERAHAGSRTDREAGRKP